MVQKDDYIKWNDTLYRVLLVREDKVMIIDCKRHTMPKWNDAEILINLKPIDQRDVINELGLYVPSMEELTPEEKRQAHERYTMIAGILAFLHDDNLRNQAITSAVEVSGLSRRTITTYLCIYLITGKVSALADKRRDNNRNLTQDEKNMRWALNKFYYTRYKHKLTDVYIMLLKEKYTDSEGELMAEYPSIYQFRYFFYKTRKKQTELISREGIKEYQLNYRPLLGDGVQEFAPAIGTVALDATICDLYIVDDAGKLIGRPIFVIATDMHCGFCLGYSLLWEGGMYSVKELLVNIMTDKVEWCRKHGILISKEQWDCSNELPGVFVTDRGSEYISANFEQITELGCQVISLESFSANMKGPVEKLFDLIQDSFKPYLKGKGVIEPDFQKRGIRDYRKDACLTITQFEQIILRCILYHNCGRILENYPFTEEMIDAEIKPYPADIWNYGRQQAGSNMLGVSMEQMVLTLLPRTEGKYTRYGLRVNKMRYHAEGYTEQYLAGGKVIVAYNPDDVSEVFICEDAYQRFKLIEKRYSGKSLEEVQELQKRQREYTRNFAEENLKAKIELAQHIETIAEQAHNSSDTEMKGARKRRKKAKSDRHNDLLKGGQADG